MIKIKLITRILLAYRVLRGDVKQGHCAALTKDEYKGLYLYDMKPIKMEIYCEGLLIREIFMYTLPFNNSLNTEFEKYLEQFDISPDYEVYVGGCLYDISKYGHILK